MQFHHYDNDACILLNLPPTDQFQLTSDLDSVLVLVRIIKVPGPRIAGIRGRQSTYLRSWHRLRQDSRAERLLFSPTSLLFLNPSLPSRQQLALSKVIRAPPITFNAVAVPSRSALVAAQRGNELVDRIEALGPPPPRTGFLASGATKRCPESLGTVQAGRFAASVLCNCRPKLFSLLLVKVDSPVGDLD